MQRKKRTQPHDADLAIGLVLKRRRVKLRMTMAHVAKELGWRYQTVQRYENGEVRLSFSALTEMAAVLQTSADEISAEATGARPEFDSTVERSLLRITARLSKVPEQRRPAAVTAMLAILDAYLENSPAADAGET